MEERNITVTLEKAKEWYNSNIVLREVALQAFSEEELKHNFKDIKTFDDGLIALGYDGYTRTIIFNEVFGINKYSKASAAMFKLNIVRKALNLGQDLHLTKGLKNSYIYYPYNPFVTKSSTYCKSELNSGKMEIIGKIKSEGEEYNVLGGGANIEGTASLGYFHSNDGVCYADAGIGFLGCATKEIAQHFGKYFGVLITEAKYGDIVDFEIIDSKYNI